MLVKPVDDLILRVFVLRNGTKFHVLNRGEVESIFSFEHIGRMCYYMWLDNERDRDE